MPETVCASPTPNPSAIPAGIVDTRDDPSPGVFDPGLISGTSPRCCITPGPAPPFMVFDPAPISSTPQRRAPHIPRIPEGCQTLARGPRPRVIRPPEPPHPGGMPETACTSPTPNPSAIPAGIVDTRDDPSPGVFDPGLISGTSPRCWITPRQYPALSR